MDINAKIKLIAETMTGYSVVFDTSNGANVELSKITMPCILVFIQETGEFASNNSHYRDSVNIRVAFLNKMPKGFKESDVEAMRYALKQDMVILYHKLKFDFQFKINNETVRYEIVYDEFDDNLIGVVFNDNIKERVGLNLACDVPDSHGELPSSPSFCQKVSECSSIVSINELIEGLQEQIDNLPTTTGVQSVTGSNVDNTDPLNPIVNPLGLIQIDDKYGDFFTDLASATAYIEQFITPSVITDKSFNEGIFFFTVPPLTMVSGYFLTDNITPAVTYASLIDRFGLLDLISCGDLFYMNAGHHIIGDGYFSYSAFNLFSGTVEMNSLYISSSGGNFGQSSTGKFIIKGSIGISETANFGVNFFLSSTATIFANASKYTSNSGAIHGDLQTAITNGCNVFFDGIDKEDIRNKSNSISDIASTTKYPVMAFVEGRYLTQTGSMLYAATSGTDTYTATLSPAITSYVTGMTFRIYFGNTNTITNPTINFNGVGAVTLKRKDGLPLHIGSIKGTHTITYNGTYFVGDFNSLFRYTDSTNGTVSSAASNTLSKSVLIPANTITNGSLNIIGRCKKAGSNSFGWLNIYVNTANNMSGATLLRQMNSSGYNTLTNFSIEGTVPITASSFVAFTVNQTNGNEHLITNTVTTVTIDWTVDQYVILAVQSNGGADTLTGNFLSVNQL